MKLPLTSVKGISTLFLSVVLLATSSQSVERSPLANSIGFREDSNLVPKSVLADKEVPGFLRIRKDALDKLQFIMGVECASGNYCYNPYLTFSKLVHIKKIGKLFSFQAIAPQPDAGKEMARFDLASEDLTYYYLQPSSEVSSTPDLTNGTIELGHRYLSNHAMSENGSWFVDNFVYFKKGTNDIAGKLQTVVYFREIVSNFEPRHGNPSYGFFHAEEESMSQMDEYGSATFDPSKSIITRIAAGKKHKWLISAPEFNQEERLILEKAVKAWEAYLPAGTKFEVEFLDEIPIDADPFVFKLYAYRGAGSGITGNSFNPISGETFAGVISVSVPGISPKGIIRRPFKRNQFAFTYGSFKENLLCDMPPSDFDEENTEVRSVEDSIRVTMGVIDHEIGHLLGLRHNFKGSTWDEDLQNFPAGASIMEYPFSYADLRIGPYDRDAIKYGYEGLVSDKKYPMCSDGLNGWFFGGAIDTDCMRWDATNRDPFAFYENRLHEYFTKTIPSGINTDLANYLRSSNITTAFRYLLSRDHSQYSQSRFDKGLEFLNIVDGYDLADPNDTSLQMRAKYYGILNVGAALAFILNKETNNEDFYLHADYSLRLLRKIANTNANSISPSASIQKQSAFFEIAMAQLYQGPNRKARCEMFATTLINELKYASLKSPELEAENAPLIRFLERVYSQLK